jgi:hypothetical protein
MVFLSVYLLPQPRRNIAFSNLPLRTSNDRRLFSSTCQILFSQLLSFPIHAKNARGTGLKSESQANVEKLSPLESALPQNAPVTPSESALPDLLDLKSFGIRTYKKGRGVGALRLTRNRALNCELSIVCREHRRAELLRATTGSAGILAGSGHHSPVTGHCP